MGILKIGSQAAEKKKPVGLNILIAKTHELGNQFVSLQMTTGNLVAIALSACQITLGMVLMLSGRIPPYVIALLSVLTCALALVIERFSLGGLGILRKMNKQIDLLEERYHKKLLEEQREATTIEKYDYKRKMKKLHGTRNWCIPVVVIGIAISIYLGDQFWRWVFSSADGIEKIILSLCCAIPISLTFVFSEIHKDAGDDTIEDNVEDTRIKEAVLRNAEHSLQLDLALESVANVQTDVAKRRKAVSKMETGLLNRLDRFAENSLTPADDVRQIVSPTPNKQVAIPEQSSRTKYKTNREAFRAFMMAHPEATLLEIMVEFGIVKSTASDWRAKLKKEELKAKAEQQQKEQEGEAGSDLSDDEAAATEPNTGDLDNEEEDVEEFEDQVDEEDEEDAEEFEGQMDEEEGEFEDEDDDEEEEEEEFEAVRSQGRQRAPIEDVIEGEYEIS